MDDRKRDIKDGEEADDALSLNDFEETIDEANKDEVPSPSPKYQDRRSTSEPAAFFEFLTTDLSSDMSHAEDIIFSGKLIPLNQQKHNHYVHVKPRRCESLSELKTQSNTTKSRFSFSPSISMDDKKLGRNSSINSVVSLGGLKLKVPKPRWDILMFGLVKFPPEMDLRDIKNRQLRRSFDAGKKVAVNRRSRRKGLWGLLRLLSCKDHASVAVTASFGCLQH